jgi:hypothetical protein
MCLAAFETQIISPFVRLLRRTRPNAYTVVALENTPDRNRRVQDPRVRLYIRCKAGEKTRVKRYICMHP